MNPTIALGARFALDVAVKATFLFTATGAALFALRRAPAAARHLVGTAGLAAALALPLLTALLPRVTLPLLPGLPAGPGFEEARDATATHASSDATPAALRDDPVLAARTAQEPPAPVKARLESAPPAPRPARRVPWLALALAAWAAGFLFIGVRLFAGWLRVRRIAREAEPLADADWSLERDTLSRWLDVRRKVEILESPAVPVAMTSGFFRPLLLLGRAARSWAVERRRVVLLHELAHVKRGDWLALLAAETAVALYWFHPAAWLLARRVRNDGEHASDDLVLAAGTKPSVYAGHLLGIFRSLSTVAHPVAPALAIVRPSHFEERLRAILDPKAQRRQIPRGRAALAAAAVLAAGALVAVVEPWAPDHAGAAIPLPDTNPIAFLLPAPAPGEASARPPKTRVLSITPGPVCASASGAPEPLSYPLPESGRTLPAVLKILPGVAQEAAVGFLRASNGEHPEKKSGSQWYSRGMDLHHEQRYDQAIAAFQKAIDEGYREGASSYNIACGYALKGDADKAFEWLHRAMDAGFDAASYLAHDDDLDDLRSDPRWKELKKTTRDHASTHEQDKGRAVTARFERLSANPPQNGQRFFEIGKELLNAQRYDLSAKAFQAGADRGYRVGTSLYNEACALSRGGESPAALDRLQQALDAGFDQPDLFRKDDDLDNVRDEPRFAEIEREARALSLPGFGTDRWTFGSSWQRSKWREAATKLEGYAREHPQKGRAWFNLGFASLAGDRPEAAAEAFQKALDLAYRKPTTMYNLACSYARLDQKDKAFDWLFRALESGFDGDGMLRSDDDLENLRGDPRYRKALEIARARENAEKD